MELAKLYKVDDTPVFYSPSLGANRQELFSGLCDGSMTGYATDGSVMSSHEASDAFIVMADFKQSEDSTEHQVYRNMQVGIAIISCVRAELISVPDGSSYLSKLAPVIGAIQVGMLDTASQMLLAMIPDEVLTNEQLTRWASLCSTADAVVE